MSTFDLVRPAPTILVHCELDAATEARTALAFDLARRSGGTVTGVSATPVAALEGTPHLAGPWLEMREQEVRAALESIEYRFRSVAQDQAAAEWRSALASPTDFLVQESCAADLLVIGPQRSSGNDAGIDAGAVVLTAGRPVLVVPDAMRRLDLRTVLVAWKNRREARRAVLDALLWLASADRILIVSIVEDNGDELGLDELRKWLEAKGLRVDVERRVQQRNSAADDLLEVAEVAGADLIVAGAYSRAPFQERIFGGVTRELLHRGRAARLLSH